MKQTLYAFTDVGEKHILTLSPRGWGFVPLVTDDPREWYAPFVVCGEANADHLQQFFRHDHVDCQIPTVRPLPTAEFLSSDPSDGYVRRVAVGTVEHNRSIRVSSDMVAARIKRTITAHDGD